MNFIVLGALQEPSPLLTLSADRLVLRATKESREREVAEEVRQRQEEERRKRRKGGRKKRGRSPRSAYAEAAAAAASRHSLRISGTLLRSLCLAEASRSCKAAMADAWVKEIENLNCVMLHTAPELSLQTGLRLVAAADMAEYLFDVRMELLVRGRLLVFTSWDNLAQVAVQPRLGQPARQQLFASMFYQQYQQQHEPQEQLVTEQQQQAEEEREEGKLEGTEEPKALATAEGEAEAEGTATASAATATASGETSSPSDKAGEKVRVVGKGESSSTPQQRPDRSGSRSANTPSTPSVVGGNTWANRYQRQEAVLDVVPAHTSSEDIRDINELMDAGVISADTVGSAITAFLCFRCGKLPVVTLTMSCCGALLCPRCLPTPPTVDGAPREERTCSICQEEPLQPPQSHPKRDLLLSQLVKELKVLFHPQLRSLRRRGSQAEVKRSPDVKGLGPAGYLMDGSSLGLL